MAARKFIRLPLTRRLLFFIFSQIHVSTEHFYNGVPCWERTSWRNKDGYTMMKYGGVRYPAHRIIYQIFVEEVPPELECDHLCRVPYCVNPVHIEPVTPDVNRLRGVGWSAINARKTHCKRGHEFTPENTQPVKNGRTCRACVKLWHADPVNHTRVKAGLLRRYYAIKALPADHPDRIRAAVRQQRAAQKARKKAQKE